MSLVTAAKDDYIGQDMRGCVFNQFNMTNTRFQYTLLSGATFIRCVFTAAIFAGADLTNAAFYSCKFENGTNFENSRLVNTKFEHCVFQIDTHFHRTVMHDTVFVNTNLDGADFSHVKHNKTHPTRIYESTVVGATFIKSAVLFDDKTKGEKDIRSLYSATDPSSVSAPPIVYDTAEFGVYLAQLARHPLDYVAVAEMTTDMGLKMLDVLCKKYGIKCANCWVRVYCDYLGGILNMEGGSELIAKLNSAVEDDVIPIYFELQWRGGAHANMLFLDNRNRNSRLYHFDPHGRALMPDRLRASKKVRDMNLHIGMFARSLAGLIGSNPIYVGPNDMCPSDYGFQIFEERAAKKEYVVQEGNCLLWSLFFADAVFRYPRMDIGRVYENAFKAIGTNKMHKVMRAYMEELAV